MKICLKTDAMKSQVERVSLCIRERLPDYIDAPCELTCDYQVKKSPDYYLLGLDVKGILPILCQRCLGTFEHHYHHVFELAVCQTEAVAERAMSLYDAIVSLSSEIDLLDILTDDLHLYCPQKHETLDECAVVPF